MTDRQAHLRYCRGCIYRAGKGSESTCDYLLMTGRRRPCPGGPGCTARDTDIKKLRAATNDALWKELKQDERL